MTLQPHSALWIYFGKKLKYIFKKVIAKFYGNHSPFESPTLKLTHK